jgi:hypothetical protein
MHPYLAVQFYRGALLKAGWTVRMSKAFIFSLPEPAKKTGQRK